MSQGTEICQSIPTINHQTNKNFQMREQSLYIPIIIITKFIIATAVASFYWSVIPSQSWICDGHNVDYYNLMKKNWSTQSQSKQGSVHSSSLSLATLQWDTHVVLSCGRSYISLLLDCTLFPLLSSNILSLQTKIPLGLSLCSFQCVFAVWSGVSEWLYLSCQA